MKDHLLITKLNLLSLLQKSWRECFDSAAQRHWISLQVYFRGWVHNIIIILLPSSWIEEEKKLLQCTNAQKPQIQHGGTVYCTIECLQDNSYFPKYLHCGLTLNYHGEHTIILLTFQLAVQCHWPSSPRSHTCFIRV